MAYCHMSTDNNIFLFNKIFSDLTMTVMAYCHMSTDNNIFLFNKIFSDLTMTVMAYLSYVYR